VVLRQGEPTAIDTQTSDAMQQYWTNIAKTGNPNGGNLPGRSCLEAVPAQGLTETLTSALVQQHGNPPMPTADQLFATTRKTYSPGSLKVAVVAATPL